MKLSRQLLFLTSALTLLFSATPFARSQTRPAFTVVAETGYPDATGIRTLNSFDGYPSINELGIVSFVGKVQGADGRLYQNVYTADTSSTSLPRPLMSVVLELPQDGADPTQLFSPAQINDQNIVLSRRRMNARVQIGAVFGTYTTAPFTYLEKWDAAKTTLPTELVAEGDGGLGAKYPLLFFISPVTGGTYPSPFVPLPPFDGIHGPVNSSFPSINSSGATVFAALKSNQNLLATPVSPPYQYNTQVIDGPPRRPRISDKFTVVAQLTSSGASQISLFNYQLSASIVIAGLANGFTDLGQSPAISRDGSVVVFYGNLTPLGAAAAGLTPGEGIFASVDAMGTRTIRRIAGLSGNGYLDPGETYVDKNKNGRFDPDQGETDSGTFYGFFPDENLGVSDKGLVVYLAKRLYGYRGLYSTRLDPLSPALTVDKPQTLAEANQGDTLDGVLPSSIQDISIYDPVSKNDGLTFWVGMGPTQAIVATTVHNLKIRSARMKSSHEIEVMTARYFGKDAADVGLTITLTGQFGNETEYSVAPQRRGFNSNPVDPEPLVFDLDKAQVPRFTKSERITIKAKATFDNGDTSEDSAKMAILLPVVVISGVTDYYQPHPWESTFVPDASDFVLKRANILGEGYRLSPDYGTPGAKDTGYGTVYTLSYSASTAIGTDLYDGIPEFNVLLERVRGNTWADKVDLIGYSFGGITARACVNADIQTPAGENVVHSVITLGSPHAGTPYAYVASLPKFPWIGEYLGSVTMNANNVRPLWPARRRFPFQSYDFFPPGGGLKFSNPQLARLSGMLGSGVTFPISIPLYLYYSDSYTFPFDQISRPTGSLYTMTGVEIFPPSTFTTGDGFITADSQRGILTDPNAPTKPAEFIPAFRRGVQFGTIITRQCPGENHASFKGSAAVLNSVIADLLKGVLN